MPRKTCTKQFKCEVVALYESTPRATVNAIAFDIGVNRTLLGTWLDVFGTDTKTIADGERERPPAEGLSDAERIWLLECEDAKLREEREIVPPRRSNISLKEQPAAIGCRVSSRLQPHSRDRSRRPWLLRRGIWLKTCAPRGPRQQVWPAGSAATVWVEVSSDVAHRVDIQAGQGQLTGLIIK